MSLTNPNKPVTEARLQEFYHRIKNFLGFTEMPSEDISEIIYPLPVLRTRHNILEKFDKSNIYSLDETVIGCWIDGKPIYQKIIIDTTPEVTADGTSTSKNIDTGISIDTVVHAEAMICNTNGTFVPLYAATGGTGSVMANASYYVRFNIANYSHPTVPNQISLHSSNASTWSNKPIRFILQYTKTTDQPNSFNYTDENEFSFEEKVIGKTPDGNIIYRKLINCGTPLTDSTTQTEVRIPHNIGSDLFIIDVHGNWNGVWGSANTRYGGKIPYANNDFAINVDVTSTDLRIVYRGNWGSARVFVWVDYTKVS